MNSAKAEKVRHPGFEPESLAWEARMLTTTPIAQLTPDFEQLQVLLKKSSLPGLPPDHPLYEAELDDITGPQNVAEGNAEAAV